MVSDRESVSEQSKKRTNYLLLIFGIVLALLFLLAWCRSKPEEKKQIVPQTPERYDIDPFDPEGEGAGDLPTFSRGDAQLIVTPPEVVMTPNVVIGSQAEAPIILRAENAPILLTGKSLAEQQEDGFELSGPCMTMERLAKDEECVLTVSWTPKTLRNIQNTLTIQWREHSSSVFKTERTNITLKAQSTDSQNCVICENPCNKTEEIPQKVLTSKGEERDKTPDEEFPDNVKKGEKGYEILEPEKIPLNLKNEVMGSIAANLDIIDANGKKIGRLLGDNTIIDPATGTVIGQAVPMTSVMNEYGHVFGKMVLEGDTLTAVDAKGAVVGFPRVDGQVVDGDNNPVGYISPWGAVIDFTGNFFGTILPDGSVVNGTQKVASMRPMGFAVNEKGELVGGVVPRGVAVGAGGRSLGTVSLNGEVKDSFDQVIGHVLVDGSVVDADMNEMGSVIRQGLVINNAGKPIGFVNSEGKALNFKATQIGIMNPDGTAFAYKKFVGTLMPKGQITKGGCSIVGSVYPNGSVVDLSLKTLGYVTPEGKAVDDKKRTLGTVVPWGTAIAPGCRLLGLISLNGSIVSSDGVKAGCVNPDKTVQNLQGQTVGEVTPFGLYMNDKKQVIGRVRLDGQIIDNKGQAIGCVYEKQVPFSGFSTKGIVVDENGRPLGGTSIGNKAYDEQGILIGDIYFNGWVIGEKGQLKGAIPFSGVVFSDTGAIVGSYNQLTGALTNAAGANLGRVLPGFTVINQSGTEILGKLIPEKTPFMRQDGRFLGSLRSDGVLVGSDLSGSFVIHADGSVTDKKGQLVGGRIPMGPVLSGTGKYVGMVNDRGEVMNNHHMKIGHVLLNGLAISDQNQVLGQVFPPLSVGISTQGFLGSVEPKIAGTIGNSTYELQINDTRGNRLGAVSGSGVILTGDAVAGRLVPIAPFVNADGKLLGWMNFTGGMNDPDGRSGMTVLPSGTAWDASRNWLGSVVYEGVAVDTMGAYLGRIGMRGEILSASGERIASVKGERFLYNADGMIVGQLLKPGIAVDLNNQPMGWTRFDGQIENGAKVLGAVGLDGHVFDVNGQMIGRYLPFGTTAFNDAEKSVGFLTDSGEFADAAGLMLAGMGHEPYVATKGTIIGRETETTDFVTSLESGRVLGLVSETGSVLPLLGDKSVGELMTNDQFVGTSHHVEGGLVVPGLAVMPTLGMIGAIGPDGQIYKAGKKVGTVTGTGIVYSTGGELIGGVFAPGVLIDKKGLFAGTTSGTPGVFKNGQQIGNKLAFRSALSTDNAWIGNVMPSGGIVNDIGQYYGVISTTDGTVVASENAFGGRVLPDGSVAGVPEKAVFNTMPYAGHTVQQGVPIGLNQGFKVIGKTTTMGDVEDDTGRKLYRITDNGYVVNKGGQKPYVVGRVLPFISAVNNDGEVMGIISSDGTIVSYQGEVKGRVDNAGRIRLNEAQSETDEQRIQGILVPEGLVVNDCKIVGQTAYDGRVINGQGVVVGRIQRDLWAVDANGTKIGRVVSNNEPCISGKTYVGRTLPDSTVVDLNGVEIGCAMNSGEVLSPSGEKLCTVVPRGIVFDPDGNPLLMRSDASLYNGIGIEGYVGENRKAYDLNDNEIGPLWDPNQTLFMDENNRLKYGQGPDDVIVAPNGDRLFVVPPMGPVTGMDGNPLPGLLPYIPGMGYLQGCDLVGPDGQKVASLKADGSLRDSSGNLIYTVTPDGQVFAPNGDSVEGFRGIDIKAALKQCGVTGANQVLTNHKIQFGSKILTVGPNGLLFDEEGIGRGYLGEDGRPYTWDNKPMTEEGEETVVRPAPDIAPKFKPTPAQIDDFQEKLTQKRQGMKTQMGRGILTISAEMKARAKPKKDKDWKAFGYERTKENTSTWPVDMTHVILQGKAIPAVLARSIDSRYTEVSAIAIVETNIYGEEGRNILIPAGSRLIGKMAGTSEQQNGVAKLQITWERLIRPDGSAFNLAGAHSGDAQGRGGVAAYLDEQLWNKYGTSLMGVLAQSAVAYMMATNEDVSTSTANGGTTAQTNRSQAANDARKAFIDEIGTILDDMIDRAQQTPPVVFVPAGTRLTVFPERDLWLRSVEDDEEEANEEFGEPSSSAQTANVPSWTEKRKQEQDENASPEGTPENKNPTSDTNTPLYDGTSTMPDISDRKVEPVMPQKELLSN